MPSHSSISRCLLFAALAAAALLFALTSPAAASESCDAPTSQPFLPWDDEANYSLLPDGGFEAGADGWDLGDEAEIIETNEPFHVGSPDDSSALRLPVGSSALSPPVCITLNHPFIRLFAAGGSRMSRLLVRVVLTDEEGNTISVPLAMAPLRTRWRPTQPIALLVNQLAPHAPDGELHVRFRFTAVFGPLRIDDVYLDPWKTT